MRLEAIGQRSETVRRSNLSAIVRELHDNGPASRSELVARTGLTRSAIRGLIGELAAADLVVEERAEPQGTPGRPSPVVRIDPDGAVVLALEIAVDSLAAAIVGLGGQVFERIRVDRLPATPASTASLRTSLTWRPACAPGDTPGRTPSASAWPSSGSSGAVTAWCRSRRTSAGATFRWATRSLPRSASRPRSRSPTTPTSARSWSSVVARPSEAATYCSSRASTASVAASSSTASR